MATSHAAIMLAEMNDRIVELSKDKSRLQAERDRLREALDTILMLDPAAEDAAFLAVTVAGEALQEARDE